MKITPTLLVLATVLPMGCDRQSQVIALREEFQHQLDAKEKTIEDLNRRMAEAERQRTELEQAAKSSADPGDSSKIAAAVADAVAQKQAAKFDELKGLIEKLGGGRSAAASSNQGLSRGPDTGAPEIRPRPEPDPERGPASDPNRKKFKMDF